MQVVRIEAAERLQLLDIQDDEVLAFEGDQPIPAQALEHPVHMHARQADGIGQLGLGDRQLIVLPLVSPTVSRRSSSSHRRWATRCSAERAPMLTSHSRSVASSTSAAHQNARAMAGRSSSSRIWGRGIFTTVQRRERGDGVVHGLEDEDMQVAEVARHEIGHDLTGAVRQRLVAAGEALQDEVHVAGASPSRIRSIRGPTVRVAG